MDRIPGFCGSTESIFQTRSGKKLFAVDCFCDAGEILKNGSARAEMHVPDFGITHLLVGEADIGARTANDRVRKISGYIVPNRCFGAVDRVKFGLFAKSPAVEDKKHDRLPVRGHLMQHRIEICCTWKRGTRR